MATSKSRPDVFEWPALVVDLVDAAHLLQVSTVRELPVERVKIPFEDLSKVAIVSWRWGSAQCLPSVNLACALLEAKKTGIRHLFIDIVSIDQHLTGDELIQKVLAFSMLYTCIPVIAAYDEAGGNFEQTTLRPWIFYEMRCFRVNPTSIVYVGHEEDGGARKLADPLRGRMQAGHYRFRHQLSFVWQATFAHSVLGVLFGRIGMHSIADFKYFLPKSAQALASAYGQMNRNDYLLTVIILAKINTHDWSSFSPEDDISTLAYDRYTFCAKPCTGNPKYIVENDVLLDGTVVADWSHCYNGYFDRSYWGLEVLEGAEKTISAALGLSRENNDKSTAMNGMRRFGFEITSGDMKFTPFPRVGITSVSFREAENPEIKAILELSSRTRRN
ncbi:hypothetical protein HDV63DRAFT_370696 [Trichoderma sp. SZMC 28014]